MPPSPSLPLGQLITGNSNPVLVPLVTGASLVSSGALLLASPPRISTSLGVRPAPGLLIQRRLFPPRKSVVDTMEKIVTCNDEALRLYCAARRNNSQLDLDERLAALPCEESCS